MNIRHILALIFIVFTLNAIGQNTVNSFLLPLKEKANAFPIVNSKNQNLFLFLSDEHKIIATNLDRKLNVGDFIASKRPDSRFKSVLGYTLKDNNPQLYWSTDDKREILLQDFNFQDKSDNSKIYKLSLNKEQVICTFSEGNNFYVFSVLKNTNNLKMYRFNPSIDLYSQEINLDSFRFYDSKYQKTTFYHVLKERLLPFEEAYSLEHISTDSPTSLTSASKKRKYYLESDKLTITIDTNKEYTQLISINLNDGKALETIIYKPFINFNNRSELESNSFLLGNNLYQYKLSTQKQALQISDLQGTVLSSYETNTSDSITYKNTDLIQIGGDFKDYRILDSTSAFLSKVKRFNSGIIAYNYEDGYIVKWGSTTHERPSTLQNISVVLGQYYFGVAGASIAASFYNPTLNNLNAYTNRKTVYTAGIFDPNFKHKEGAIPLLAFDKIQEHWKTSKISSSAETIFKYNSKYYVGYFDKSLNRYVFKVFIDN